MEYQFAIIKSKYTFKKKRILNVSFFILKLVLLGIYFVLVINNDIEDNLFIFVLIITVIHILSFLFHKFIIDIYKVIGTIIFDSDKITILPENTVMENKTINHIYYGNGSSLNVDKKIFSSYFIQIEHETGETKYLNLTRNQHNSKKFLKRKFFKRRKDLFYVFEKLEINHSYKKPKNFLIQR